MFFDPSKIVQLRKDWQIAGLDSNSFLKVSQNIFENIRIGGTFIPEGLAHEGLSAKEIMLSLQYIVEDLGVKSLRLGIRLNNVDLEHGSLGLYKEILDYCFKNKVKMTLNLGPIKFCGWPEYHLSNKLVAKIPVLPKNKSTIKSDSAISEEACMELESLLRLICVTFTKKNLENVVALQEDHLTKIICLIERYLPDRKYLFNSAGFFDLDSIVRFISTRKDSRRFIVGLDYYYIFDSKYNFGWYKWLDLFVFSWKWRNFGLGRLKKYQQKYLFETEVTEAQMEPWGRAQEPGNSIKSLQYVLLRTSNFLLNNQGVVHMYGLEKFGARMIKKDYNDEHKKMAILIKRINHCVSKPMSH
jgi:hypothetical protein